LDLMLQITGGRRHSADGRGQMFSTAMPPLWSGIFILELLITCSLLIAKLEKSRMLSFFFWGVLLYIPELDDRKKYGKPLSLYIYM
jgi:hypothetical protein